MTPQPPPPDPWQPAVPDGRAPFTPVTPEPFRTPPPLRPRRSGGASGLTVAVALVVLIAGCSVSFALGRATAPTTPAAALSGQAGDGSAQASGGGTSAGGTSPGTQPNVSLSPNGNAFRGGGDDNGGFGRGFGSGGPSLQGTVQAVTGTAMTVTLSNGATITVGLTPSTTYHQQTTATQAALAPGANVILRVSGRFGDDAGQGGSTLGTATDVTVVP